MEQLHSSEFDSPRNLLEEAITYNYNPLYTNDLSGLPNRRAMNEMLDRLAANPDMHGQFGVIFVDLDGLKEINDTEDHHGGDKYLRYAASALRDGSKLEEGAAATVVHLSGDEFVVIVLGMKEHDDLQAMKEKLQFDLDEIGIPSSMGARLHEPGEIPSKMLRDADARMYMDKIERKLEGLTLEQREGYLEILRIAIEKDLNLRDAPAICAALVKDVVS